MNERRCSGMTEVAGIVVGCDREFGHGGAHNATIDDPARDPDFTYVVSWWPSTESPGIKVIVPAADIAIIEGRE